MMSASISSARSAFGVLYISDGSREEKTLTETVFDAPVFVCVCAKAAPKMEKSTVVDNNTGKSMSSKCVSKTLSPNTLTAFQVVASG